MERRRCGATGLDVPVIVMGTWGTFDVDGAATEAPCRRVVDVALAGGEHVFDTSPMYGRAPGPLLGGRRDQAVVATKVWASTRKEGREQKWILSNPRVRVAIPATGSPEHMAEDVAAGDPPWLDAEARDLVSALARRGG